MSAPASPPPHELEDLTRSDDKLAIAEAIRTGLAAMNEVWCERLAVTWTGGLATPPAVRRLAADVYNRAEKLSFSDLPENSCWILHQLPLADHQMYTGILRAAGSVADRLTFTLEDLQFPGTAA